MANNAAEALWEALKGEPFIDDWYWQTHDVGPADVQTAADSTKPAHYREAARELYDLYARGRLPGHNEDFMHGIRHAADLLHRFHERTRT